VGVSRQGLDGSEGQKGGKGVDDGEAHCRR
jgi:hypothetical protein